MSSIGRHILETPQTFHTQEKILNSGLTELS
jgi:hypothetical protein